MKEIYNNYIRRVIGHGSKYEYTFVYDHSEDLTSPHVKSGNSEYIKYSGGKRHVFYEDISLRKKIIFDESAIGKAGRPVGSKDGYKRTRTCGKRN